MVNGSIVITGASKGIGKALVTKFAQAGFKVVAASRDTESVKKYVEHLQLEKNVSIEKLDVTSREQILEFVAQIEKNMPVAALINNAGITSFRKAEHDTFDMIENIVNTNLLGAVNMIKSVLPGMIKRKNGVIINIVSVAADKIFTNSSIYAATKTGLLTYGKVLREEVRERNIKVINVLPGATETDIWSEDMREKFGFRMMQPDDIAEVIFHAWSNSDKLVQEEIILRPILGDL